MDPINKAYGQLAAQVKSLTPGARLTAALALVAVLAGTFWLVNQQVSGATGYLMGGEMFSPGQLRDMQAAFGQAGLEAHVEGARVRIPQGQESKYMAALAESHALPVNFGDYLNKALGGGSLLPLSRSQQEAALKIAKQQELQLILGHMSGIDKAAVQIDQARSGDFPRDTNIITAAVMVQPKGTQPLDDATARTIRQMVASSVAGLKPEAVTVVDLGSHRSLAGTMGTEANSGGTIDDFADYKRRQEVEWQQKISHVLEYIPGVLVSATVELNGEVSHEETSFDYDRTVPSDQRPARSGAGPLTQKHVVRQGLAVKRVNVSVAVPQSYYEHIWRQGPIAVRSAHQAQPAELSEMADLVAREKQKIEALVANLLPRGDSPTAASLVAVSTFYPMGRERAAEPAFEARALAWLDRHTTTVFCAVGVLAAVLVLRSLVKSLPVTVVARAAEAEVEAPTVFAVLPAEPEERVETASTRYDRAAAVGPSLHDELAGLVRDDPDAAASILRTWIGNAS
ncbi:MAG TPA: hypothetical protein VHV08_15220 [Pirellulales bacterium]|jgi:flagellar M-ring protein FliF|nr:hypothetical protein [Pirellulales bacterium]